MLIYSVLEIKTDFFLKENSFTAVLSYVFYKFWSFNSFTFNLMQFELNFVWVKGCELKFLFGIAIQLL